MRYTTEAMEALKTARANNPNMSQRRLARNISEITSLSATGSTEYALTLESTRVLFRLLGRPTEAALQHLIRRIDRQVRADVRDARETVASSEALSRKKTRTPRNRKTAGTGLRISDKVKN